MPHDKKLAISVRANGEARFSISTSSVSQAQQYMLNVLEVTNDQLEATVLDFLDASPGPTSTSACVLMGKKKKPGLKKKKPRTEYKSGHPRMVVRLLDGGTSGISAGRTF